MKKLAIAMVLFSTSAMADVVSSGGPPAPQQAAAVPAPQTGGAPCIPIGKTDKGDLIYSMDCQNVPTRPTEKLDDGGGTVVHPPGMLPPSQPGGAPQTGSKSDPADVCSPVGEVGEVKLWAGNCVTGVTKRE